MVTPLAQPSGNDITETGGQTVVARATHGWGGNGVIRGQQEGPRGADKQRQHLAGMCCGQQGVIPGELTGWEAQALLFLTSAY